MTTLALVGIFIRWVGFASLATFAGCMAAEPSGTSGPTLTVSAVALSLSGVGDVVWDVEVLSGGAASEVVWRKRVSSSQFGDGRGSASYVGPCDASVSASLHSVRLWVVGVYAGPVTAVGEFASGAAGGVVGNALPFENPSRTGPLVQTATCAPNADTPVRFDVAILRPAEQGFFDIAVNFNDIFCSAKFDCCVENAAGTACVSDLSLLHDGEGTRSTTFVLGFACTAGPRTDVETELYLDALELDCTTPEGGFVADLVIDPSGAPGNQCGAGQVDGCLAVSSPALDADGYLYQVGVYRGFEQLTSGGAPAQKAYWNVALGVVRRGAGVGAVGIEDCRLRTRGTADDALSTPFVDSGVIAPGAVYPYIEWDVELGACGAERLAFGDATAPVRPVYTSLTQAVGTAFVFGFGPNLSAGPFEYVSGVCGLANGESSPQAPSSNLCESGSSTAVVGVGPFSWSCLGEVGGATASCVSDRSCLAEFMWWESNESSCEGLMPAAPHGETLVVRDEQLPSTGSMAHRCDQGVWLSVGPRECVTAIDGLCGPANEGSTIGPPQTGLCEVGGPSDVGGAGPFHWLCEGLHGGGDDPCSADRSCEAAELSWVVGGSVCSASTPTSVHGATAALTDTTQPTTGALIATCNQGAWTSDPGAVCVTAVNGSCGPVNGTSVTDKPATNLCSSGAPSLVNGTGPYTWSCIGSNGGASATCNANRSCPWAIQSWSVGASTCSGAVQPSSHGWPFMADDPSPPATGTRWYVCNQGNWSGSGNGSCTQPCGGSCGDSSDCQSSSPYCVSGKCRKYGKAAACGCGQWDSWGDCIGYASCYHC